MSAFFSFAAEHWWIALFMLMVVTSGVAGVVVNLPNLILRHWNIHKHGYPPAHCDADGDFKPEQKP